ncbi:MAG: cupin domain-containing protein [Defluviitaleaceae bacterium]|nr:cupin domain-containing protein [Defluviitaleaceae bacterium]
MVFLYKDAYLQTDTEEMTRRVLAHDKDLMLVEMTWHKIPADPYMHSHPHSQIAQVTKGTFEFVVEEEGGTVRNVLKEGDSIYFRANVVHGSYVLEVGSKLVDIFTPERADFLPSLPSLPK